MSRQMIDATHDGLQSTVTQAAIRSLSAGNGVALYDTGSSEIAATPGDIAAIPRGLFIAMIDQGYTGSPNMKATVRDCENGAWSLDKAVNRDGWDVSRPTLYLGYPDTAIEAYNLGWRGDVWLVGPATQAPTKPPTVPTGITVVAVQWQYTEFDRSVIFDPTWPAIADPPPPPILPEVEMILIHVTGNPNVYLYNGTSMSHVFSVADEQAFESAGVKSAFVSAEQFAQLNGALPLPPA